MTPRRDANKTSFLVAVGEPSLLDEGPVVRSPESPSPLPLSPDLPQKHVDTVNTFCLRNLWCTKPEVGPSPTFFQLVSRERDHLPTHVPLRGRRGTRREDSQGESEVENIEVFAVSTHQTKSLSIKRWRLYGTCFGHEWLRNGVLPYPIGSPVLHGRGHGSEENYEGHGSSERVGRTDKDPTGKEFFGWTFPSADDGGVAPDTPGRRASDPPRRERGEGDP